MKVDTVIECICYDPRDFSSQYKFHHLRQDPLYFVDLYTPASSFTTYANCYLIDKESLKIYQHSNHTLDDAAKLMKKHKWQLMEKEPFIMPKTRLAKIANKMYHEKPKRYWHEHIDHPIFTSIVCDGTDTFSHKQERGIPERNPGHEIIGNKKRKTYWKEGSLTGVFIGLSNLLPIRKFHPKGEVLNQIKLQTNSLIRMYRGY